jgi:hypothetical protein
MHRPRDLPDPRFPIVTKSLDLGALTNIEDHLTKHIHLDRLSEWIYFGIP